MRERTAVQKWSWSTIALFLIVTVSYGLAGHGFAETQPVPCSANTERRQLDYWLGTWIMPNAGAATNTSKVYLSLDKCMFVEHWENGKGHITEKMLAYSPEDNNWYGLFADNEGRVHVFQEGKVDAGVAEFRGKSRGTHGETVLNRLRVIRHSPNNIEESWEKSTDNGMSWTTAYRAQYTRANH